MSDRLAVVLIVGTIAGSLLLIGLGMVIQYTLDTKYLDEADSRAPRPEDG